MLLKVFRGRSFRNYDLRMMNFLPQSYTEESQRGTEIAVRFFAAFCGFYIKMKNKMVDKDAQWYAVQVSDTTMLNKDLQLVT